MKDNPMKTIYKHFGKEKEEGQEMSSIANIFYEMGNKEEPEGNNRDTQKKELTDDELLKLLLK